MAQSNIPSFVCLILLSPLLIFLTNARPNCAGDGSKEPDCSSVELGQNGYLPHQFDCSKFWECGADMKPCLFECPPISADIRGGRLFFNVDLGICDWPFNVDCTTEEESTTPENTTSAVFSTDTSTTSPPTAPTTAVQTTVAPTTTTPVSSTAISSTPVSSTPVSSTSVSTTPVSSMPVSTTPVSSTPDSSIPASSTSASPTPASPTPASSTEASSAVSSTTALKSTTQNTTTGTTQDSIQDFLCQDYYCSYIGPDVIEQLSSVHNFESCEANCTENQECAYFTFTNLRNRPLCYLLTGCQVKTPCANPSTCQSGHKECA